MMQAYLLIEPQDLTPARSWAPGMRIGRFTEASQRWRNWSAPWRSKIRPTCPGCKGCGEKLVDSLHGPGTIERMPSLTWRSFAEDTAPDDVDVSEPFGEVQDHAGREEEAIKDFSEAIELEPEARRHLLLQGHGPAISSRAEIGGRPRSAWPR